MSEYIYANIVRNGSTTIASNIYVHLAKTESREGADYQGTDPAFTYRMDTRFLPTLPNVNDTLVQQGDHVIDLLITDPKTGQPRKFLVISDPQPKLLMMSWHWIAVKMRGT